MPGGREVGSALPRPGSITRIHLTTASTISSLLNSFTLSVSSLTTLWVKNQLLLITMGIFFIQKYYTIFTGYYLTILKKTNKGFFTILSVCSRCGVVQYTSQLSTQCCMYACKLYLVCDIYCWEGNKYNIQYNFDITPTLTTVIHAYYISLLR